jgi:DNA recombination protein RmuC
MVEIVSGFLAGAIVSIIAAYLIVKSISKIQSDKFQLMANDIIQSNTDRFQLQAKENFSSAIVPLNQKVTEYKEYLDQMHKFDLKDRESLREKLNQMISSAERIETETNHLSRALSSDVKFQGAWGELTLERILELAGLEKNSQYYTQESYTGKNGKVQRPDVVIKLPNNAHIIIDSKVSLKSYFDYINLDNKEEALKLLKISVQTHIDSLAKKNYHHIEDLNSPDFVYLFVPVEGVYSLILSNYPELIDESIKKNIVLVSPVNIMTNLKTVASLWRLEKQSKNAEDMANKAGAMYDKFVGLINDFEKLGTSLTRAQSCHDDIVNKLSTGKGNLISRSEELKELGAKTNKSMNIQIQ